MRGFTENGKSPGADPGSDSACMHTSKKIPKKVGGIANTEATAS